MALANILTYTKNQLIREVLQEINVVQPQDTISPQDYSTVSRLLNRLIKSWQADGIHLWTYTEGTLFVQANQYIYLLGPNSHDYCTSIWTQTTLNADALLNATTLTVVSTADMLAGDFIGIQTSATTLFWTTIASITNATTVVLTTGLNLATASGADIFNFTNRIARPLLITNARRNADGNDIPMTMFTRQQYFDMPTKNQASTSVNWYYSPQLGDGVLYLWQAPSLATDKIKFTFIRPLQIPQNASDLFDFPEEWYDALVLNLALKCGRPFNKTKQEVSDLQIDAEKALNKVLMWDTEPGSFFFSPDSMGG